MYEKGFAHGKEHATLRAFGHEVEVPYFDTPAEERDWYDGFRDGYDSVAD